jgi:glucose/arabinose dehydrogenase
MAGNPATAATEGAELYQRHCAMCHGAEGRGVAGVFPPLAQADFLHREREKSLRAPLVGLSGEIVVNGQTYRGGMPPVTLDDAQIAAVFGHVFASWGNQLTTPTREDIAALRATTKFPTHAALLAAMGAGQLPAAPEGWELTVGAELTFSPVRLAAHPDGERILILGETGDVWSCRADGSDLSRFLEATAYLDPKLGRPSVLGLTVDRNARLYLVSNQRDETASPVRNEVTIFRTAAWSRDQPWSRPTAWLRTSYPWGVGPYNHGVSHIAQGPDGMLYVNSGSRTDGGEAGTSRNYAATGEDPRTASMWRLDPNEETPAIEIFARGLRNNFGFCWDDHGHLLATENGPDADTPEELNVIEGGKHYGFPFQFSDWTAKPYPHTPDLPPGLVVTKPLSNLGPDAGGNANGSSTFDPHSCPSGIVWIDRDWPAPLGGTFLTARFGNLLQRKSDVGFDVLQLQPDFAAGTTTVKRLLAPLGRPIDLLKLPGHRVVVAEYCRGNTLAAGLGSPGRLLLLAPKVQATP